MLKPSTYELKQHDYRLKYAGSTIPYPSRTNKDIVYPFYVRDVYFENNKVMLDGIQVFKRNSKYVKKNKNVPLVPFDFVKYLIPTFVFTNYGDLSIFYRRQIRQWRVGFTRENSFFDVLKGNDYPVRFNQTLFEVFNNPYSLTRDKDLEIDLDSSQILTKQYAIFNGNLYRYKKFIGKMVDKNTVSLSDRAYSVFNQEITESLLFNLQVD